jgi:hypothetical protein
VGARFSSDQRHFFDAYYRDREKPADSNLGYECSVENLIGLPILEA